MKQVHTDLNLTWGPRSRAFTGPSSALSAKIVYLGARPGGGDVTMTVDRPAEVNEQQRTYRTTEPLEVGSTTVRVTFYADANGQGTIVGLAETPAQVLSNGTLGDGQGSSLGNIVTIGTIKSIVIPDGQRIRVDETKAFSFSARDAENDVVAVSGGSFFIRPANGNLRVNADDTITGVANGTVDVELSTDGITASTLVTVDPSLVGVVQTMEIKATDLVYSPLTQRVYATVSPLDTQYPNRIVAIDPITATVTGSVETGGDPDTLAIADDGRTLYVGLRDAGTVRSYDTVSGALGTPIFLGSDQFGLHRADDIVVQPGHPKTIVVTFKAEGLTPRWRGMTMFDNGVARPKSLGTSGVVRSINRLVWGKKATEFYGLDNDTPLWGNALIFVDAEGLTYGGMGGTFSKRNGDEIFYSNDRLFSSTGLICQVENLTGSGDLPLRDSADQAATVDPVALRFYSLTSLEGGQAALDLFSTVTQGALGTKMVPGFNAIPKKMIVAGQNLLAVTTAEGKIVVIDPSRLE